MIWGRIEEMVEFYVLGGLFLMTNLKCSVTHGYNRITVTGPSARRFPVVGIWGSPMAYWSQS